MKYSKTLGALAVVAIALASSQVFASSDDSSTSTSSYREHRMHGSGSMDRGGVMGVESYLRTDLTDTEKTAMEAIEKTYRDGVRSALESNGTGTITDTTKATIQTLQTTFVNSMLTYVTTDKQTEFTTKFSTVPDFSNMPRGGSGSTMGDGRDGSGSVDGDRPEWNGSGSTDGNGRWNGSRNSGSGNTSKKNNYVSTKLESQIENLVDAKLATYSVITDKTTWINTIISKIDSLESSSTSLSAKNKAILEAVRSVLQDRLDTLNGGTSSTTDTIGSILQ